MEELLIGLGILVWWASGVYVIVNEETKKNDMPLWIFIIIIWFGLCGPIMYLFYWEFDIKRITHYTVFKKKTKH